MEKGNAVTRASVFSLAQSRPPECIFGLCRASEEGLDGASTTATGHRLSGLNALTAEHKTHGQVPETLIAPPPGNLQQEEQYLHLGTDTRLFFLLAAGKASRKSKRIVPPKCASPRHNHPESPTPAPTETEGKTTLTPSSQRCSLMQCWWCRHPGKHGKARWEERTVGQKGWGSPRR